jgi:2-haloacid dehalogenase
MVTRHFSCAPGDVAFVSSNRWDVMGAAAFGFRPVWVNRAGNPDEYRERPPALVVANLQSLLSAEV